MMQVKVKIPARFRRIFAKQTRIISFINRGLQRFAFADVFAANVNIAGMGIHRETGNQTAFDQCMRIMAHNFAVFTGARLRFVSINNKIRRTTVTFLGHKRPFQTGGKSCATTAAQPRCFHLVNNPVTTFFYNRCGAIPMATLLRPFEAAVMHAVKIGKNPIFIFKHLPSSFVLLAYAPEL